MYISKKELCNFEQMFCELKINYNFTFVMKNQNTHHHFYTCCQAR